MTAPHQSLLGSGAVADTSPSTDPNFNETVLLVHGDGTNGDQNNDFTDSSTNNLTITANGEANQGTFSPFLGDGYYSTFFDGSANLQKTTSPFATNLSTFTVEAWIYMTSDPTGSSSHSGLVGMNVLTDHNNHLSWGPTTSRKLQLFWYSGGNNTCTGSTTLELNRWYFISLVVNSNAISMQVDGVAETLTGTTTLTNRTSLHNFIIGANGQTQFIGYTTNIRISDNARTITVPSTPLTEDSNTLFLYCGDNRFKDPADGTESISFNTVGGRVMPFSPYPLTYNSSTHLGSGHFGDENLSATSADDHDDYIYATLPAAIGTGNMTAEFWWYPTKFYNFIAPFSVNQSGSRNNGFNIGSDSGAKLKMVDTSAGNDNFESSNNVLTLNEWQHIAMVRSGSTVRMFRNGVQIGTKSNTNNWSGTRVAIATRADALNQETATGYIANCNLVVGTAKYDASGYTVPTSPITAHANTKFLVNFANGSIIDTTMKNNLRTGGNAQIDTSIKKFGTGSVEFDGTGDFLRIRNPKLLTLGTGDFTIEMFVYARDGDNEQAIYDGRAANGAYPYLLIQGSSNKWMYYVNSEVKLQSDSVVSTNQWVHLVIQRTNSVTVMYVDGTKQTSYSQTSGNTSGNTTSGEFTDATDYLEANVTLGQNQPSGGENFDGLIDDIRVSKIARYSGSSITVPNLPHPDGAS